MPDLILHSGSIITVDRAFRVAEAVVIKDGKFLALGCSDEIRSLAGPHTEVRDLGGKTVLPGFVDSHTHALLMGGDLLKVQLSGVTSISDVLDIIREQAKATPPGEWIETTADWRATDLKERRVPNRQELDAVAPNNSVFLPQLAVAAVNTCALRLAGITRDTLPPPLGDIGRDPETGALTGVLRGTAISLVRSLVPLTTYDDKVGILKTMEKVYNRAGTTSIIDPGLRPQEIQVYQDLWAARDLKVRAGVMLRIDTTPSVDEISHSLRNHCFRTGFGNDMLRLSAAKLVLDGVFDDALLRESYPGRPGYHGMQFIETEKFKAIVKEANRLGWQVAVHAIGGRAMDVVLQAYEAAHQEQSVNGKRHVIIHAFQPNAETFEKCREMGVVVSVQQPLLYYASSHFIEHWGWDQLTGANPQRAWLDQGLHLAGGTDVSRLNPLLAIWSSVTRGTETDGICGPEQAITREEALRLYTIDAAYLSFEEDIKGSIEPGKLADMLILSDNPLACSKDKIKDIEVLETILGGRTVYTTGSDR